MEMPLRIALCTAAALALLACNTTGSRVRQHQEAFDAWPPHVQHNLRNGVIEVGYAPEMVLIALGAPHRKMDVVTGEAITQVWTWWQRTPGIGISLGGFSSIGSHVGIGSGLTLGEGSHREEKAVVEFRDGRVQRFHVPAP